MSCSKHPPHQRNYLIGLRQAAGHMQEYMHSTHLSSFHRKIGPAWHFLALATLGLASAKRLQQALVDSDSDPSELLQQGPASAVSKPLTYLKTLQELIIKESLLAGAKALHEVTKRSEDEYGHPTRVIGSAGHAATLEYVLGRAQQARGPLRAHTGALFGRYGQRG